MQSKQQQNYTSSLHSQNVIGATQLNGTHETLAARGNIDQFTNLASSISQSVILVSHLSDMYCTLAAVGE